MIDALGGLTLLAVALLPMLLISLVIFADDGWPVLIRQRRIGQHGLEYRMWKFRTLPTDTPEMAKSQLGEAAMRLTPLSGFLRRHSLDELPQLLNVVGGQMSLVGPRPALYTQNDLTSMRLATGVLAAKPGLTGLAQVSGRENLDLSHKVALDADYVRNMSLVLDFRIAIRTIGAVLRPRGSF